MKEAPYLHTGVDHFHPRFPARIFEVTEQGSAASSDYFLLVYRDGARRIKEALLDAHPRQAFPQLLRTFGA